MAEGISLRDLFVSLGVNVDQSSFDTADRLIARLEGTFDGIKDAFNKIPEMAKNIALGELLADVIRDGIQGAKSAILEVPRQIEDAIVGTAEAGNEFNKLAIATGVSAQSLQEFKYVAEQTETPFEAIRMGIFHIQRQAYEAAQGGGEATQAFRKLGVEVKDRTTGQMKGAEALFIDTVVALGRMNDQTAANAISFQLFGRGTAELAPLLRQSREEIAQMRAEYHEFGAVMDKELIQKGVEWDNSIDALNAAITGLRYSIGGPLIHYLTEGATAISGWVKVNREWIATDIDAFVDGLAETVRAFLPEGTTATGVAHAFGAAVATAGGLLWVLGKALGFVTPLLKYAAIVAGLYAVGLVATAAGEIAVAVGAMAASAAGLSLVDVLWKIGIALAYVDFEAIVASGGLVLLGALISGVLIGLIAIADDLYVYSQGGKSLFGRFVSALNQIHDQIERGDDVPWFLRVLVLARDVALDIRDLIRDITQVRILPGVLRAASVATDVTSPGFSSALRAGAGWLDSYADQAAANRALFPAGGGPPNLWDPAARFGSGSDPVSMVNVANQGPYQDPYAMVPPGFAGSGPLIQSPTTIIVQAAPDPAATATEIARHLDARDEKLQREAERVRRETAAALVNPAVEHP